METSFNSVGYCVNEDNVENYRRYLRGHSGFYCKKCFYPIVIRLNVEHDFECDYNLNFNVHYTYKFKCPKCGAQNKYDYELDPNITPTIAMLNKKGYKTNFCCEGHYTEEGQTTAYILFDKSVPVDTVTNNPLPKPWFRDCEITKDLDYSKLLCIRCSLDTSTIKQRCDAIYNWASKLPTLKIYKDKDLIINDNKGAEE